MSDKQYFSTWNGYHVKDTEARAAIVLLDTGLENMNEAVMQLDTGLENMNEAVVQLGTGLEETKEALEQLETMSSGYVKVFDTVSDMKAESMNKGVFVHTLGFYKMNDGGGADYLITEIGDQIPNGASIIALESDETLAAVLISDVANVKQYGARADMENDDAPAFNLACASGKDVYIPGGNYLIKNVVNVGTIGSRKIYSDARGASGAVLYLDGDAYFHVTAESTFFDSVRFIHGSLQHLNGKKAILAEDLDGYDTDLYIENCLFSWFEYPVHVKGRGLQVHNTLFVCCGDCVVYEYIGIPDTGTMITDRIGGGRAFAVTNCRFHALYATKTAIKIAAGSVAYNPLITNNQMDAGYGYFVYADGEVYGGVISNNVINLAQSISFMFRSITKNCMIVNNSLQMWNELHSGVPHPTQMIRIEGSEADGICIRGNSFRGSKKWAVVIAALAANNIMISDNMFDTIGLDTGSGCGPIVFTVPCNKMSVCNNVVKNRCDGVVNFIQSTGGNAMTDSVVLGNVLPDGMNIALASALPSDQNTIQEY